MNAEWNAFAPYLTSSNCVATSPETINYNCLAFAAGVTDQWWEPYVIPPTQPGVYWPSGVHPDDRIEDWVAALATRGFAPCPSGTLVDDQVKVALYAVDGRAKHAARQLKDGRWASKLGDCEDIVHLTVGDVAGGDYGEVVVFLARPRGGDDP